MKRKQREVLERLAQKQLKAYTRFFKEKGLESLVVEQDGLTLTLEGEVPHGVQKGLGSSASEEARQQGVGGIGTKPTEESTQAQKPKTKKPSKGQGIPSPITGTFYAAPSPESKPFVSIGDEVKEDTTICIVEAMKNMNEIRAGTNGTITDILVKDGEAVQSGQVLVVVE